MKFVAMILLFFALAMRANARENDDNNRGNNGYQAIISAFFGQKHGLGSSDFFDDYAIYFGGKNLGIPIALAYGASIKIILTPKFRFGICGEHFTSNFNDNYSQPVFLSINDAAPYAQRIIEQRYSTNMTPLLITSEYAPFNTPYRTYFGVGAGVAFGSAKWTESVQSTDKFDRRVGGKYIDKDIIAPAGAAFAGVELAFDRTTRDGELVLLTAEARYTIISAYTPIFEKAANQFSSHPARWNESASLGASGLTLQLGISFQFNPRSK